MLKKRHIAKIVVAMCYVSLCSFRIEAANPMFLEITQVVDRSRGSTGNPTFTPFVNIINQAITNNRTENISAELCPNVYEALAFPSVKLEEVVLDKISSRLDMLRAGVDNFKTGYMAGDIAGGCLSYGPFFFGNGIRQETAPDGFAGFDSTSTGLGWVGDKTFSLSCGGTGRMGAGVAASYLITTPRGIFTGLDNSIKAWSIQPLLYGSFEYDRTFVDGILGVGYNRYTSIRNLPSFGAAATGKFNGYQIAGKARVGYVMPLVVLHRMPIATIDLTPLAALQYVRLTQQQYQETGAGLANLQVIGQHSTNYQFSFGGKLAAVNEPRGFYTEIHAMMLVDYKRSPLNVTAQFVSFGPAFNVPGITTSRTGVNVGASSTLSFAGGFLFTAGLDYEGRKHFNAYTGWARVRWLF